MEFTRVTDEDGELIQPATIDPIQDQSIPATRETHVKSKLTKHFLEEHFRSVFRDRSESIMLHEQFQHDLQNQNITQKEKKSLETQFANIQSNRRRAKRRALRPEQFDKLQIIGRGAFGEVWLVRDREDNEVYAMKILRQSKLVAKNQILNTLAERDFLTQSNNPWSVDLIYAFADTKYLYLVLEFLPGGDLMNLLMKRGILTETETRFFIAETLLAIHNVHNTGFIHRDIKPDNLLLTKNGHIRLTDFGLSTKTERYSDPLVRLIDELTDIMQSRDDPVMAAEQISPKKRRDQVCSTVGTPDYIAPEVLLKQPYTKSVDFWSLGAIMYEMLFGSPPFFAETARGTAIRIVKWRDTLVFPPVPQVSPDAVDLIRNLLCSVEDRLDFEGIKNHRFFSGMDWDNLQNMESPYIPVVKDEIDTRNFDEIDPIEDEWSDGKDENEDIAKFAFMGFMYNKKAENITTEHLEIIQQQAKPAETKKQRRGWKK